MRDGNSVGDHAPEARARQMSTELNVANATFLGDPWTILDCPGSVELLYEAQGALLVSDVAVVVVEPEVERALTISALLAVSRPPQDPAHDLHQQDGHRERRGCATCSRRCNRSPSARWCCARCRCAAAEQEITGYVDLVSERAYRYRPGAGLRPDPAARRFLGRRSAPTRTGLIEKLADFDDQLLEQLLEEVEPPKEEIYKHLTRTIERRAGRAGVPRLRRMPDHGIRRLWKALRHEAPSPQETAARLGIAAEGEPLAQVFKTYHLPHTGKLSLARVWRGTISEGMVLNGSRVAGLLRLTGRAAGEGARPRRPARSSGLTRMEEIATGTVLTPSGKAEPLPRPERAAAGVRAGDRRRAPHRRRQADRRASASWSRKTRRSRARAERRHPGDGAVGPGRHPPADRDRPPAQPPQSARSTAGARRCPTRRRSGAAPSSIPASSARAAGTGSSPISRSS